MVGGWPTLVFVLSTPFTLGGWSKSEDEDLRVPHSSILRGGFPQTRSYRRKRTIPPGDLCPTIASWLPTWRSDWSAIESPAPLDRRDCNRPDRILSRMWADRHKKMLGLGRNRHLKIEMRGTLKLVPVRGRQIRPGPPAMTNPHIQNTMVWNAPPQR
jgi:hypothetical protein